MDPTVASVRFTETALGDPPDTTVSSPVDRQIFTFPLNPDGTVDRVASRSRSAAPPSTPPEPIPVFAGWWCWSKTSSTAEFYCGPGGCPGQPGVFWRAQYTTFPATVPPR